MYRIWLRSMGFKEIVITNGDKKCLDEILEQRRCKQTQRRGQDRRI